jgi:hypothetical protein
MGRKRVCVLIKDVDENEREDTPCRHDSSKDYTFREE